MACSDALKPLLHPVQAADEEKAKSTEDDEEVMPQVHATVVSITH